MTEIRKITLQFPSLRAFLAQYGACISTDGILLRGEAPPAAGSTVDIEVVVAEGMRLVRARGETLWSRAATGTGGEKAAAVRFHEMDDASRTLIGKIVDQQRREGAEPFSLDEVPGPRETRLRDLTVPAASAPEGQVGSAAGGNDSIFDLAEPAAGAAEDLFSELGVDQGAREAPAADAGPAGAGPPAPPVPLLADPASAPFDLGPVEVAPETEVEVESAAHSDLSDLFASDAPEMPPASGRTEAFPASFVDEVEAELEATDPSEAAPAAPAEVEVEPGPELETGSEAKLEPAPALAPGPEFEVEPEAGLEAEPEPAPEAEPQPEAETEREAAPKPESEPPPPLAPEAATPSAEAPRVAQAFEATHGRETVEIPIIDAPSQPVPRPVEEPPLAAEPPPAFEAPSGSAGLAPPVPSPPPVEMPPPAAPAGDNLLAIPEFKVDPPAEASTVDESPGNLLSSAQSLRGAASRSQRLGTWLLMVLLVGALGVAGYFLTTMIRGDGDAADQDEPAGVSTAAAPDKVPAEDAAAGLDEAAVPAPLAEETAVAQAGEVTEPVESAPAGPEPASVEPRQPGPAVPLTGLDRISWTETAAETVLTLTADGAISRRQVEVLSLGGDQPRLVIQISGVQRAFQPAVLEVGTSQVRRVRTGLQSGGQLHVVVDLAVSGIAVLDLSARGSRVELRLGTE